MSQTRSRLNPNGSTSGSIADPGDPLSYLTVPLVMAADGSGVQNVFTVSVPADKTVLQMGAGNPSGVRISTAKHIDLAAGAPKTTICLGEAQGVGAVDGLSVFSAAKKDEHIGDTVNIWYESDTTEKIDGKLDVTVGDDAKYDYEAKLSISSEDRTEKVDGTWKATIAEDMEWTVTGDSKIKTLGNRIWGISGTKHEEVVGLTNEVLIGGENKEILGEKAEVVIIGETKTVVGGMLEMKFGGALEIVAVKRHEINLGPESELSVLKKEVGALDDSTKALEKRASALEKLDIATKLDTMQANLVTMDAQIVSLGIAVYK